MQVSVDRSEKKSVPRIMINLAETIGLAVVFFATMISIGMEVWHMIENQKVELGDLLLLFIFLEVVSMVGIYYESHRVPVRFPIYIAMTALSRTLILDFRSLEPWLVVAVGGTILVLALAVLAIRYGHLKFPYGDKDC